MFNACENCGVQPNRPTIDEAGAFVCPHCGHRKSLRRLPLLMVGGPAGAGKSTAGALLLGEINEAVVFETDLLWRREFNTPSDGYLEYFSLWLRLAAHVAQSGRPAVLFGAGFAVPHSVEPLPERRLFTDVHYLALVCDDDVLAARLRRRPKWKDDDEKLIAEHLDFNRWLKEHAATTTPPVTLLDTSHDTPEETAARVAEWIKEQVKR